MVQKIFSRMMLTRIISQLFVALLLEILMVEVCFSNSNQTVSIDDCDISGKENCYFVVSYGSRFYWKDAHGKCKDKNSSLPIIRNREEQTSFESYLRQLNSNALITHAVWMSGKSETYNNWTWINGQILNTIINISDGYAAEKTHMAIAWWNTGTGLTLRQENFLTLAWYLCQYKDHQCNGQHEVSATNGCLIPSVYGITSWYEARNECLSKGGDLAILTDQDLQNLKNHSFPYPTYWIGLRRINWVWQTNSQASPEEEVKYTKWRRQSIPTDGDVCMSIYTNDGQWRTSYCSLERLPVICEKRASTPGISATKTTDGNSPYATVRMADCINDHNDVSSSLTVGLVLGIGVVVPLIVIIIILIIIILKLKKKLRKMSVSPGDNTIEAQQYEELQRPETYANASDDYIELRLSSK